MAWARKLSTAWTLLRTNSLRDFWYEFQDRSGWSLFATGSAKSHERLFAGALAALPTRPPYLVSVVVPVFNGGIDLRALVASLAAQRGCSLQVLLLDSGSTDGSLEGLGAGVEVVRIPAGEFSHSGTRNLGVSLAHHPFVFLTVQDATLPDDTWLYRLCALLEEERLGALAAGETARPDADLYARYSLDAHYQGMGLTPGTTVVHERFAGPRRERIRQASIGNVGCLYRRDLFSSFSFEGEFGEDFTLGRALVQHGVRVGKTVELCVVHSHLRPAWYALRRMFVSHRLMTRFDLGEPGLAPQEPDLVALLQGFVLLTGATLSGTKDFGASWVALEERDPALAAFLATMDVATPIAPAPAAPQTLVDVLREVEGWNPEARGDRGELAFKAMAARVGWVLGAAPSQVWTREDRRKAVDALASGI